MHKISSSVKQLIHSNKVKVPLYPPFILDCFCFLQGSYCTQLCLCPSHPLMPLPNMGQASHIQVEIQL